MIATTARTVVVLQEAVRLMAVGIDFAKYLRFRTPTPNRYDYINGGREYRPLSTYAPTDEDVAFCRDFVVETALRLAQAEKQIDAPSWFDPAVKVEVKTIKKVARDGVAE